MASIYEEVKERVTVQDVASYLNLKRTKVENGKDGEQYRYPCPSCKNKDTHALSVNVEKGKFQCFSCGGKGNDVISLVAFINKIRQSEAAKQLHETFCSAVRTSSSTEARSKKVELKGRSDTSQDVVRPLEILGIDAPLAKHLGIVEDDGRVMFDLRDAQGIIHGTLAIATRDDLPLVEFTRDTEHHAEEPKADGFSWPLANC